LGDNKAIGIGFTIGFLSCLALLTLKYCCYRFIRRRSTSSGSANLDEHEEQGEELTKLRACNPFDNDNENVKA